MIKFSIEDEVHAEWQGDFLSFEAAMEELVRRAKLAWDQPPNRCPCSGWKTCERIYTITEFEVGDSQLKVINESEVLTVSSKGAVWFDGFKAH